MLGLLLKSLSQKACHRDDIIRILGSYSNRNYFQILKGFSSSCPTYCLPDLSGQFELTFTIISLFVLVCVVHKIKWFVRVKRHKSQASLDILTKKKNIHLDHHLRRVCAQNWPYASCYVLFSYSAHSLSRSHRTLLTFTFLGEAV